MANRSGASEQAGHIEVGEVESLRDHRDVHLGVVARKAGPPDPWISLQRFLGGDHPGLAPVDFKVELVMSMPCGFAA